jgi:acetyl esterase/lipase
LDEAGVPAELTVGEGLLHIYPLFAHILPEGQAAIERIGAFVRDRVGAAAA